MTALREEWLTFDPFNRAEDKWDSHGIRRAVELLKYKWTGDTTVVVFPAGPNAHNVERLNEHLATHRSVLLILTADECSIFPGERLRHPRMIVWRQTPNEHPWGDRYFGYCCPDRTLREIQSRMDRELPSSRPLDWMFCGQVTHDRRRQAAEAMRGMMSSSGLLFETNGFAQGFDVGAYAGMMLSSKVVVCPAGAATPDTFRVYEALEAGCVPVVDALGPDGQEGYWDRVYGQAFPCPKVHNWEHLPDVVGETVAGWDEHSEECSWWWAREKEQLPDRLLRDLKALGRTG